MNLNTELNKPLFFRQGRGQTLNEVRASRTQTLHNFGNIASASSTLDREILNEAINRLSAPNEDIEQLIVLRLKSVPDAKYKLLDGRVFSGTQAAEEVKNHTKEGRFFF